MHVFSLFLAIHPQASRQRQRQRPTPRPVVDRRGSGSSGPLDALGLLAKKGVGPTLHTMPGENLRQIRAFGGNDLPTDSLCWTLQPPHSHVRVYAMQMRGRDAASGQWFVNLHARSSTTGETLRCSYTLNAYCFAYKCPVLFSASYEKCPYYLVLYTIL